MPRAEIITSAANPLLKEVRRAVARGALTAGGLCVAETFHLLEEALRSEREVPVVLAAESVRAAVERHVRRLAGVRVAVLPDNLFQAVSGTETSQGVIALVAPPCWSLDQIFRGESLAVILDGLQDPGNAGAICRAAEAFGATGVVFVKGAASPFHPKTIRAAAGSLFRLPFVQGIEPALVRAAMAQHKLEVWAAVPAHHSAACRLDEADLTRKCAVVIGNEARGSSQELGGAALDLCIPTLKVESLNAAVAAGIILYEARRQRAKAPA